MNNLGEKLIIFGLICGFIGIMGLLTILGIAIATMGIMPICIYVCGLLILIGMLACSAANNKFKHPFEH